VAAAIDCSVGTLSNAERGASLPTVELFLDLAGFLDLNLGVLVEDQGRRRVSKARLALEAEAGELARALADDKLKLWLGTGKVLKSG
jgi:transcriptional regulator with XRE-family HTH domain